MISEIYGETVMKYTMGTAVFNDWIITEEIGQGATGQVYEIKKNGYGEEIRSALKVIRVPKSPSDIKAVMSEGMTEEDATDYFKEFVDEILREIKIMVSLKDHPNIVTYEDHCVIPHEDGPGWDILIKMELLTPLQEWQVDNPMNEKDIIRLGSEISSALVYAADHDLIHRDVKPENIFVDSLGRFKLGDFGIARTIEKTTGGLSKKGTESYMAPEVYLGKNYNAQADIYSLGIVLYRFLNNNRLPFYPPISEKITYSDRENALMKRIQGLPVPEPETGRAELKKAVLKACEYLPENRYATINELKNELQKLETKADTETETEANSDSESSQPKWKKIIIRVGLPVVILAGVTGALWSRRLLSIRNELERGGLNVETTTSKTEQGKWIDSTNITAKDETSEKDKAQNEVKKVEVEIKHGEGSGVYDMATGSIQIRAEKIEKFKFLYWAIEAGDVNIENPNSENTSISFNNDSKGKIVISAKYEVDR